MIVWGYQSLSQRKLEVTTRIEEGSRTATHCDDEERMH